MTGQWTKGATMNVKLRKRINLAVVIGSFILVILLRLFYHH